MINIIENTMIDPIKMKCGACMSTFTCNFNDIRAEERDIFSFSFINRYKRYIQCPVCKVRNMLPDAECKAIIFQNGNECDEENTCES